MIKLRSSPAPLEHKVPRELFSNAAASPPPLPAQCCSLGLDLSGQTSASYNMRQNYERCLMDFENYLASGQVGERGPSSGTGTRFLPAFNDAPVCKFEELPGPGTGGEPGADSCYALHPACSCIEPLFFGKF
jgi:hypothetical protein